MDSIFCHSLLFLSTVFYGSKTQIIEEKENHKFKDFVDTAVYLANKEFNYRLQTVIISKDVEGVIVNDFLNAFKGTVVIEIKRDGLPPEQVVIFLESYKTFRKILEFLKPDLKGKSLLHSGTKFIIVLLYRSRRIEHIFEILWSYYVINIVVIVKEVKTIALYTYFPYKNRMDCKNTKPFLLGFTNEVDLYNTKIFPDKMKNMQECPLYISTNSMYHSRNKRKTQLQIIMETMLQLLQQVMNFTSIISSDNHARIHSDCGYVWSDSLNDVTTGFANISTCSISFGVDKLNLLDYTFPYYRMSIVWLAPPTKTGYVWLRLLSPLNSYMWLMLLILMLFLTSFPSLLKLKLVKGFTSRYFKGIHRLTNVALRTWGVAVGHPIRVSPKRFRDFYIVSLWMWFTFVVRSAYQSVLIGSLKTDAIIENFASLKEAVDHGYKFGGGAGILMNMEHDPQIRDQFEVIPKVRFEEMLKKVLMGERKFVFATSLEYAWSYCLSQGINENECGHVLPDSIMTVPLVVWLKKHSPLLPPLSMWLQRFLESGLLERDAIKKVTTIASETASDPTPLTRYQTLGCFLCLLVGYVVSTIMFCIEIIKLCNFNKYFK
ncbi:glutamate receptor ionotropic, NMDA 3A-like [Battus philenor]|uniref:glutamate receptor ionotropic, NMDA 3A-like n=1 Tax=Battus philenor TaxID=42288 RepID=UPI0035CF35C1